MTMKTRGRTGAACLAALTAGLLAAAGPAAADPIASSGPAPTLPAFDGHAAKAHEIKNPTIAPQNPFMGENPFSNIHNDTWMTDAYQLKGPLGHSPVATSESKPPRICGSLAFDSRGDIVSVCPSLVAGPQIRVMDPDSLATLGSLDLPETDNPPGTKLFQNFTGGGYFFLDQKDRMWVPTKTDHINVYNLGADGVTPTLEKDYDLTGVLDEDTERITSALPDFDGLIWWVSKANGKVGTLDPKTGKLKVLKTNEEIENSFAIGKDGIYVASDKKMYRFEAGRKGMPKIVWQARYDNSGVVKPSQLNAGTGTTPTMMDNGYVAITDNAEPMNVVVYRTAKKLHGKKRKVCEVPVFNTKTSATENSLMTAGRSLIVENNYGYQDPLGENAGAVTEAGFARVDVDKDGKGCTKVWTNKEVRAPSVVPKLSTKTGLIYTYGRPDDPSGAEGYYWQTIDWRNGKTVFSQYAGSGLSYNNNYAGIALGPDGTAYLGVVGGMLSLRDGS